MRFAILLVSVLTFAGDCRAQSPQPYAGMQARTIKSLSDQQVADLRAGRGMGLAMPAELNGYPGPAHVLELAQALGLSEAQKSEVTKLFAAMHEETVALGEKLIAAESNLDGLFANKKVTQESLAEATQAAALLQGELRVAHLRYHLATIALLTPDQIARYSELRGYGA